MLGMTFLLSSTIHIKVMPLLLVIDPINSHTLYFGENIGLNKRTVPINRTGSSNWHQRVIIL